MTLSHASVFVGHINCVALRRALWALSRGGFVYRQFAQYACRIKRVGFREEVVQDTQGMQADVLQLLKVFCARNGGVKPSSIVIYRDGVSHGEFKEVRCSCGTIICKHTSITQVMPTCTPSLCFLTR